jgi:hypothetical protein
MGGFLIERPVVNCLQITRHCEQKIRYNAPFPQEVPAHILMSALSNRFVSMPSNRKNNP